MHVKYRHFVAGDSDPEDEALHEKVISRRLVYLGRIFNVENRYVELPSGGTGERDIVVQDDASAVVAIDQGHVCLVRQYRAALGRVTVEIPAGKIESGEDPEECARRELREETGFTCGKIMPLASVSSSVGFTRERVHLFLATDLEPSEQDLDPGEFINVDMVPIGEVRDAIRSGELVDGKTMVGTLMALDFLGGRK